ncbi:MAG: alginate export family protein [Planctomycetes bacterium]|nr:alginate export family protein [Planctomycetota bacterium]
MSAPTNFAIALGLALGLSAGVLRGADPTPTPMEGPVEVKPPSGEPEGDPPGPAPAGPDEEAPAPEEDGEGPGRTPWSWMDEDDGGEWDFDLVRSRFRHEYRSDLDLDRAQDDGDNLDHYRLHARMDWRPEDYPFFQARAEGRFTRTWGANEQVLRQQDHADLYEGYADLEPMGHDEDLKLRAGRQAIRLGDERLVGDDPWENFMRSFDAAHLTVGSEGGVAGLFYGWPVDVRNRDDQHFNRPDQDVALAGAYVDSGDDDDGATLYWLRAADGNGRTSGERGGLDDTSIDTLGASFRGGSTRGGLRGEAAWQRGEVGPDDLSAFAAAAELAWAARKERRPFAGVHAGWSYASGDKDPSDGKRHAFQDLYPSRHGRFGVMDLFGWSNLQDLNGGLRFRLEHRVRKPSREGRGKGDKEPGAWVPRGLESGETNRTDLDLSYHLFWIEESRGAWTGAAGQAVRRDPAGLSGTRVADELDVVARFQHLALGYGHFFPHRVVRRTGTHDGADFLYAQVEF